MSRRFTVGAAERVNTVAAGNQDWPGVTTLADGGCVVTWQSEPYLGAGLRIYAQRYDAAGTRVGVEPPVSATAQGSQTLPSTAALSDGGYIVAWKRSGQGSQDSGIYTPRFDAGGAKVGAEAWVDATQSAESYRVVKMLADGGYSVAWIAGGRHSDSSIILMQRNDAAGSRAGRQAGVEVEYVHARIGLRDGGFIAVHEASRPDDSSCQRTELRAQRYDDAGRKVGQDILLYDNPYGASARASISEFDGGGYAIAWEKYSSSDYDLNEYGVYTQRFDATGNPVGAETRLAASALGSEQNPTVTALSDGAYVVLRSDVPSSGWPRAGLYAQRFDAAGRKDGEAVLIAATDEDGPQYWISRTVSATPDGGYVVTWQKSGTDPDILITPRSNSMILPHFLRRIDIRFVVENALCLMIKDS
ncbi:hypothetical protein [uncultured Methylobacterium sp.]|jgi:hypothetical protein|uniref:hypothetical protein n=1 Tax=uncultured Methylobacterium sp. TaxID=157278 RepID=UPI00260CA9C1|nr:hypothetical protein [uncultured Methylobacterium sp.]